jgi:hypothetical protein
MLQFCCWFESEMPEDGVVIEAKSFTDAAEAFRKYCEREDRDINDDEFIVMHGNGLESRLYQYEVTKSYRLCEIDKVVFPDEDIENVKGMLA